MAPVFGTPPGDQAILKLLYMAGTRRRGGRDRFSELETTRFQDWMIQNGRNRRP